MLLETHFLAAAGASLEAANRSTYTTFFSTTSYLFACACFVLALKWLSQPATARKGNTIGQIGMLAAVVGALLQHNVIHYEWIFIGFAIGAAIGVPMAVFMPMTAVPQRTALSHAFGALAAALVGTGHYWLYFHNSAGVTFVPHPVEMSILALEVLLGALTFTGSLMAFGKLQDLLPTRPMVYRGQIIVNLSVLGGAILCGTLLTFNPTWWWLFPILLVLALAFGVMLILPIGGGDMPTVIALLNSYAGLSASFMGFVLDNRLLIIAGALDGASGLILSIVMCKAMNRSFTNVLFGAFGQVQAGPAAEGDRKVAKPTTPEEAAGILEAATSVIIIPGYGMAVAQAQHKVRELYDQLTRRGVDVKFAIHPVAGRMPGHMNVLLAEAEIPYDRLLEMDEINGEFPQCDVAMVIGANDVVNPAARHDKSSPIYGMPIIDADKAKTVMAIKRSMNPGFAGIDNELYTLDQTLMLFGDAKAVVSAVAKELAETNHR
ncbi:MAG TPA: NAD(P)(+) transhydrogenase (Re/Si-specific) subunit beta [Tepidisphaeraceae bacterium]|nr:NAD(P)(+) transhydrogenase (Re/Si-specific) subunit beta [Tepidisphaeraceae bacterium]